MIERKILRKIESHLSQKEITVIIGCRQAGKTTILKGLLEGLRKENKPSIYLNLDIDIDAQKCDTQEKLVQYINIIFGNKRGYLFIDEIQRIENAGQFLKGIYDRDLVHKIIVTGSGSLELKEKIAESLAGRKRNFNVFTISIDEFCKYKTQSNSIDAGELLESDENQEENLLNEYLLWGGYPRVITATSFEEKQHVLSEIFQSYVERDIEILLKLEKRREFVQLLQILSANPGQIVQYQKLGSEIDLSAITTKKYIWYAEKTFLISVVPPYFTNKSKEVTKALMIYFNDAGMQSFLSGNLVYPVTGRELGFKFQQMAFTILTHAIEGTAAKLYYYRNQNQTEVDFIISLGNKIYPVEIKAIKYTNAKLEKAMYSFISQYNPELFLVINRKLDCEIPIGNTIVKFLPWYKAMGLKLDNLLNARTKLPK